SMTCSATYRATQHDMDAGRIVNEARAVGVDPSGGSVASDPSDAEVATNQRPALKLVKSVQVDDPTSLWEGVELEYVFVVTNAGNVTIDGIGIEELEFTGSTELEPPACEVSTLAPGAQTVCRANYIATIADLDGIDNTARATGETPTGQPVVRDPSPARVPF